MKIKVLDTEDGSSTIFNEELDECYHSKFGAITESKHVFIKNGLEQINKNRIIVFEVGFGTGLNALLSAIWAYNTNVNIHYISIEKYPLETKVIKTLNYTNYLGFQDLFENIHTAKWNEITEILPFFSILKLNQDLIQLNMESIDQQPDIIYFDAFSPIKQPEMWQEEIFKKIYLKLDSEGILVTYAASGMVKQALRQAGFKIKRLPGPPGKHHMIFALKD